MGTERPVGCNSIWNQKQFGTPEVPEARASSSPTLGAPHRRAEQQQDNRTPETTISGSSKFRVNGRARGIQDCTVARCDTCNLNILHASRPHGCGHNAD
jgi:hypothetical protein